MSLNSNTTGLEEILASVNALPEAGSGGGGSIETCTVAITFTGALSTNSLRYTNGNMIVTTGTLTKGSKKYTGTFEVAKGTLLYTVFSGSGAVVTGEIEKITTLTYAINGDGTITIEG